MRDSGDSAAEIGGGGAAPALLPRLMTPGSGLSASDCTSTINHVRAKSLLYNPLADKVRLNQAPQLGGLESCVPPGARMERVHPVLAMQRLVGNRAVGRLLVMLQGRRIGRPADAGLPGFVLENRVPLGNGEVIEAYRFAVPYHEEFSPFRNVVLYRIGQVMIGREDGYRRVQRLTEDSLRHLRALWERHGVAGAGEGMLVHVTVLIQRQMSPPAPPEMHRRIVAISFPHVGRPPPQEANPWRTPTEDEQHAMEEGQEWLGGGDASSAILAGFERNTRVPELEYGDEGAAVDNAYLANLRGYAVAISWMLNHADERVVDPNTGNLATLCQRLSLPGQGGHRTGCERAIGIWTSLREVQRRGARESEWRQHILDALSQRFQSRASYIRNRRL